MLTEFVLESNLHELFWIIGLDENIAFHHVQAINEINNNQIDKEELL